MTKIFNRLLLLACLMAPTAATAQVRLVSKGKPQGRIVLAEDNDVNRKAAKMLQRFVRETSGAELDITATAKRAKNDVVIGGKTTEATDDGYVIDCTRGALTIKSAGGKGAIRRVGIAGEMSGRGLSCQGLLYAYSVGGHPHSGDARGGKPGVQIPPDLQLFQQ